MAETEVSPRVLEALLRRVAVGEWGAFEELYAHTAPTLFGLALRSTDEKARAEDVLEAGYVRIWRGAGGYNGSAATPSEWLARQVVAASGGTGVGPADVQPVRPPQRVRKRLKGRLVAEAKGVRPRWEPFAWAAGGVTAAGLLVYFLISSAPTDRPGVPGRIAAEDGSVVLTTLWRESVGVLHLRREVGAPRSGRALEVWVLGEDGQYRSLGILPDARDAAIVVPKPLVPAVAGASLVVTEERPGGSPTGRPSREPVASGEIGGKGIDTDAVSGL